MAWCTIAHLGGGLAIGMLVAVRIARVVEFCTTTAELRSEHTSQQNRRQIIAKSIVCSMTLCTIAHLGGKLAIGLSIAARIALVREICIQTVIP
eukprot:619834-Rhodomonas_salina.1